MKELGQLSATLVVTVICTTQRAPLHSMHDGEDAQCWVEALLEQSVQRVAIHR